MKAGKNKKNQDSKAKDTLLTTTWKNTKSKFSTKIDNIIDKSSKLFPDPHWELSQKVLNEEFEKNKDHLIKKLMPQDLEIERSQELRFQNTPNLIPGDLHLEVTQKLLTTYLINIITDISEINKNGKRNNPNNNSPRIINNYSNCIAYIYYVN